jgi:uncharacterized protein YgiM (DUF1202 family)
VRFICPVIFVFVCAAPAQATIFCKVLKTPDGFLALRVGPSTASKQLLKLKSGEHVQVDFAKKGTWEKVIYYRRGKDPAKATQVNGWVKSKYLSDVCG